MKNISIQIDESLFRKLAIVCAEIGIQKKALLIKFIKDFLEEREDKGLLQLAEKRLKEHEKKKLKTINHRDAWK